VVLLAMLVGSAIAQTEHIALRPLIERLGAVTQH
jgi:hypothetical protein